MEFEEFNNLENKEFVIFNGKKYCKMGGKRKYFLSYEKQSSKRKNPKGLHVAIWEYVNQQKVPEGYVIHHKDHNTYNNNPDNLECISRQQHLDLHKQDILKWSNSDEAKKHLDEIRDLTKIWHKSKDGRKWHKEHALKIVAKKREKRICQDCGQEFDYVPIKKNTKYDGRWCKKCHEKHWFRLYRKLQKGKIIRLQLESEWGSLFCK